MQNSPSVGTRLSLSGSLGTVRYVGSVDNTAGLWLGIEWNDPQRGKHDGLHNGKRYFFCRVPHSGSFIRPSASGISYGTSFLHALYSKYIESPHGSDSKEKVILGSSNGAIEVEAVRLDKIRGNLSNLDRLREVSLDGENVATCDPPGKIRTTCPNIRGLDLSMSLISTWEIVALIAAELPFLQRLALNRNRLQLSNTLIVPAAFSNLTDLHLNGTMTTWAEMQQITAAMLNLQVVEIGYNRISRLVGSDYHLEAGIPLVAPAIQMINLDSNECDDWPHVCQALDTYRYSLQRLILTSNRIRTIPPPNGAQNLLQDLKHLSLSSNQLSAWTDIDALSRWCPALETFMLSGNPLVSDGENGHELARYSRQFTIARIPSLIALDAASISIKERRDCELFYLSYISQHGPKSEEQKIQMYPRWTELCTKHGTPETIDLKGKDHQDKLSNHLIELNVYQCFNRPPLDVRDLDAWLLQQSQSAVQSRLRVLPTMSLRTFRLKIAKSIKVKVNASKTTMRLWVKMRDESFAELQCDQDAQDLSWWGLENGSDILFCLYDK